MKKPKISFIGLGIMGKPMAANLLKAGYPLIVYNRTCNKTRELVKCGAQAAESLLELARSSEVVITMLPDSAEVAEVILGQSSAGQHLPQGVLSGIRSGAVVIDMSSIAPLTSQRIATELAKQNVEMLDAPVSGGESGAIAGTLAIMVGGKPEVYKRCLSILQTMGKNVVHVGPIGAGGYTKLANQIIVALNIAAMGEALVVAQKAGFDVEKVYQAIRGGLAGSAVLEAKAPQVMKRNFQPGFKISLHHKDLKNVLETARDLEIPLPLTALVQQMLASLLAKGKGDLDHGAIVQVLEEMAGVIVEKT